MKGKLKKIFTCALSFLLLFACACKDSEEVISSSESSVIEEEEGSNGIVKEDNQLIANKYLYVHGKSDYYVTYPSDATQPEMLAVDEMIVFFKEATGYELTAIEDTKLVTGAKYISFGDTKQYKETGISVDEEELGRSGFVIKSRNNNIFVRGGADDTDYGTMYGAYYLLEKMVGYKAYAADEIKINKCSYIELYNYDVKLIPAVDMRALNYGSVTSDTQYRNRMRLVNRFISSEWAINGHSTHLILKPADYFETHRDWYSNNTGTQLCFTNEEMKAEFIKNVKQYVVDNPQAIYISLTMMDDKTFCECTNCTAKIAEYGGARSGGEAGLYMAFCNDVGDAIDEWLTATYPERQMTIVTYAYLRSFVPPVKYDEASGKYVAAHEDVIPHDNVAVMFCAIDTNYAYDLNAKENENVMKAYMGWASICNRMMIYEYTTNFYWYMINFPNYFTIENIIKFYAKQDVSYYFEQTSGGTNTPCFDALRIYTESALLWDQSLKYEDLVDDFFKQYYKQAGTAMKKYFDMLRTWQYQLIQKNDQFGWIYFTMGSAEHWPYRVLQSFNSCFDEAFAAIEGLKNSNRELYEKLWHRINRERLSVVYMLCTFYRANFTAAEYNKMVSDLEIYGAEYGFVKAAESGGLSVYSNMINGLK